MLLLASLLLGGHPASGVDKEAPGSVGHVVAHSSASTVVVPEALALEPVVLPSCSPRWLQFAASAPVCWANRQ